jgi:uncharacterized protein
MLVSVKYWPFILAYIISLVLGSIALSITLIGFLIVLRSDWVPMLKNLSYKRLIFWGITGGILALFVQFGWTLTQINLFNFIPESINTNHLLKVVKSNPGMIVIICLVCPILEEIVFRKMIFGTFKRKIGTVAAAIVAAFLFSLIHFDFANTIVYMLIGLTFSWIYIKSKSILAAITSHVLMNSIVLTILLF